MNREDVRKLYERYIEELMRDDFLFYLIDFDAIFEKLKLEQEKVYARRHRKDYNPFGKI